MPKRPFALLRPSRRTSAVVFASPHSACDYPEWFVKRSLLDAHSIRSSEDAFVDRLFESVPQHGAPFLIAGAPRAFLDLNRDATELDPALIYGVSRVGHNPRVASGLGVIPRVVSNGRAIYSGKMPLSEAEARIETYWRPYHTQLQALLDESREIFGRAILLDCHSMPHEAVNSVARSGLSRPEVVLGDRFGVSAETGIVDQVEEIFTKAGLRVARNAPFAGAYVTRHYGRPARKQHAIQIEIDRSLYLDEKRILPNSNYESFKALIDHIISELVAIGLPRQSLAAE
ncbi:MAG: N-formylglutamate amidohydrolase [Rhodobacteraceae bacterium]|nr:N-formylglutamate amidohydrolase [Paracoccaceae bacterium]MCW9044319.1 N-formylglutamate amidohydrolase [Pseudopelagicola sp.]